MNPALEIMTELEKIFDENQAKVMTNAILLREEKTLANLATKDDLKLVRSDMELLRSELKEEMNSQKTELIEKMGTLKDDLRKEMGTLKDDLRKEVGTLKDDLRKEMGAMRNDMHKRFDDTRKLIIAQTRWYLVGIGFLVGILTLILKIVK